MSTSSVILAVLLTAWVSFATVRLEYLNAVAGYKLPMDSVKARSKAHGGSGAWRASRMDEETWKRYYITRHGQEPDRRLSPTEQAEMRRHIQQANANANLRNFAGSAGCVQYPAILLAMCFSAQLFTKKPPRAWRWRSCALALCLLNLLCLSITIYRGPFRAMID